MAHVSPAHDYWEVLEPLREGGLVDKVKSLEEYPWRGYLDSSPFLFFSLHPGTKWMGYFSHVFLLLFCVMNSAMYDTAWRPLPDASTMLWTSQPPELSPQLAASHREVTNIPSETLNSNKEERLDQYTITIKINQECDRDFGVSDKEYGYNSKMTLEKDSLWVIIFLERSNGEKVFLYT